MKTQQQGKDLIKFFEGLHDGDLKEIGLQPKMDPVGIWTEGWGRAIRDGKGEFLKGSKDKSQAYARRTIFTIEDADKALEEDLVFFENFVARRLRVKVSPQQFDALVCHTYNTGGSATLFDLINRRAGAKVIRNWIETRYITGQGSKKPLQGLINRRKAEAKLFFS